jgi:uncharacterized damage-inducible protein DinB
LKAHFEMLARYNQWANARVYKMAAALADDAYCREVGAYFGSLRGTLNHLLTADRIWMRRLTGEGTHPDKLNATAFETLGPLWDARQSEDARIIAFVVQLKESELDADLDYRTLNGTPQRQPRKEILAHVFNHQTHHRGQAHTILTVLGVAEPEPLDLLIMQRQPTPPVRD